MALTATATKETFEVVLQRLDLVNPVIIAVSCGRLNIKLHVQSDQKLKEFSTYLTERIMNEKLNYPKTIVFCSSYAPCSTMYLTIMGKHATNPPIS